jgi:hypothetical protein
LRYKNLSCPLSCGVGGLFFYAGIIKLPEPEIFARDIRNYRLPLGGFAEILAMLLPPVEIIAALSLLWKKTRSAGLLILGTLTTVFLLALLQAALRGFAVNCGCFGSSSDTVTVWDFTLSISRDVVLFILILWLYLKEK